MPGSGHTLPSRLSAPVVLGLAGFLLTPTITSHADMATMLAGSDGADARWKTVLTASPAGSIQAAELEFTDPVMTSSITPGAGVTPAQWRQDRLHGQRSAPQIRVPTPSA